MYVTGVRLVGKVTAWDEAKYRLGMRVVPMKLKKKLEGVVAPQPIPKPARKAALIEGARNNK